MSKTEQKEIKTEDSQVGVIGDKVNIKGGIHIYSDDTPPPKKAGSDINVDGNKITGSDNLIQVIQQFFSQSDFQVSVKLVGICTFALVSVLTFVTVLRYMDSRPETAPRNFTEAALAVLLAAGVSSSLTIILSTACQRIISPKIIIFLLIPLCSMLSSLPCTAFILNKSCWEIPDILFPDKKEIESPEYTLEPKQANGNPASSSGSDSQTGQNNPEIGDQKPETLNHDESKDTSSPSGRGEEQGGTSTSGNETETSRQPGQNPKTGYAVSQKRDRIEIRQLGMEFVYIPPGEFLMGSPENEPGRGKDEKQHRVYITKGFYMQTTEVTQGQWKAVMGSNPSYFKECGDDCPVENVSWNDVQIFIRKLNEMEGENLYRLPTEAEWEYAARAGTETAIYTGNIEILGRCNAPDLDPIAWYSGNSGVDYDGGWDSSVWSDKQYDHKRAGTHPVGKKNSNAFGLYDMLGNVWEWCQDWYGEYPAGSVTNPEGSSTGSYRVSRGGGWYYYAVNCRSAYRHWYSPGDRFNSLGFRLVLSAGQQ